MRKQMKIYGFNCQIFKLAILGLLIFSLSGCQQSCQQNDVAEKRSRVKNTPEVEQAKEPTVQNPPVPVSTAQNPTPPAATPTAAVPQPAAKPVDCDKKCYKVYDQCGADYRQFPDVETICRGKQATCLSNCSPSAPQSSVQPTEPPTNCVTKGANDAPVRVRSTPNGSVVGSLQVGTDIVAYDVVRDGSGADWTMIEYNGGYGYVSTRFISCG